MIMKLNHFLAIGAVAIMAACGTPYRATNTDTFIVSTNAQTAFMNQYPTASNVAWSSYDANNIVVYDWDLAGWSTMDASDYVVRFDMDGENYYAWYDTDGTWVGSAYVVKDYTRLPATIHTSLTAQYPMYTITSVNREYWKDRNLYEIVLKKDDSKVVALVDADGNIVKYKVK